MGRRSGTLATMPDGRRVIVFHDQPLKSQGKALIHLADEDWLPMKKDGKELTLIIDWRAYTEEVRSWAKNGYTD